MASDGAAPPGIWLQLDLSAQPIAGTLNAPGRPPDPFVGWLGLTAALEELRSAPAQQTEAPE